MNVVQIMRKMVDFSQGNRRDISHFMRVHSFARTIGILENLDDKTQFVLEVAAITHDIACPLCREKYGNTNARNQEREGGPLVREFLTDADLPQEQVDRVAFLVGHHHTVSGVDGIDYRILLEADYLANADEGDYPPRNLENARERIFRTKAGTALLESMFQMAPAANSQPADLQIRLAKEQDLPELERVYEYARQLMRDNGNPTQWGTSYPEREIILEDIARRQLYAMETDSRICGVFCYALGDEPTYQLIEDGAWLDNRPYGTIHRIAADGTQKGVFRTALDYCREIQPNVKIDTHPDNAAMLHSIEKAGFVRCGIIYHTDGTPRIAFQLRG